jgi:hypothetical protein
MRLISLAAAAALSALFAGAPASGQTLDGTTLAQWTLRDTFTPRYRPSDQENAVRAENRRFTEQNARRGPTLRQFVTPRYPVRDRDNEVRAENRRFTERNARRGPTLRQFVTPRYRPRDQDNDVRRENRRFTERAIGAR